MVELSANHSTVVTNPRIEDRGVGRRGEVRRKSEKIKLFFGSKNPYGVVSDSRDRGFQQVYEGTAVRLVLGVGTFGTFKWRKSTTRWNNKSWKQSFEATYDRISKLLWQG